ncbi:MAG TPA: SBBP repeat-containing protein [Pyrinomonadaceae bacterium]|nr:SBBP repeat-containing protein [Pyrinomonadaceae bacterium]
MVCLLTAFAGVIFVSAQNDQNNLPPATPAQDGAPVASETARTRVAQNFGKLPLSFEINKGQIDQAVKFLSHGPGYDLFLTANEAVLRVPKPRALKEDKLKQSAPAKEPASAKTDPDANVREGTVLRLKFIGANGTPEVEGQDELPGKVNYFIGNDPAKWQRNVPTYKKAYFKDVYPGIDVVYYGNQQELEYDLIVAPRANPKLIRFSVEGADKIRLDKSGKLLLTLKHGEVSLNKPVIFQLDKNGGRREVKGGYSLTGNEVRFKLENFDSSKPLIIDPILSYSTLLGSSGNDTAFGIAVDSQGNAYVTGTTNALNFPTTAGSFKATSTNFGSFISKLNATGSALVYSTYLSTNNGSTNARAIAVDSSGNAYVTGSTSGSDFPTVNGLKTTSSFFKTTDSAANWNNQNTGLAGSVNALAIARNTPNTLYASTTSGFFRSTDGGTTWTKPPSNGLSSSSFANSIGVDPSNASVVYLGLSFGFFKSIDGGNNWTQLNSAPLNFPSVFAIVFDPVTPSTIYIGTNNGVFKSTDSGSTWITQNNFGIAGTPSIRALAIDPNAPLTLYAGTTNNGAFKSTNGGGVWTAINNGMGTSNPTNVSAIVIDPANSSTIYAGNGFGFFGGGINKSTNGGASWAPLTNGVPDSGINAMAATATAVYAALNSGGLIKTTNGGTSWTDATAGLSSSNVRAIVAHPTNAATLFAGTSESGNVDAFVTKLNPSGSGLLFSTLLGGSRDEFGNGVAVDGSGNILIAGQSTSSNFPVANAVQSAPAAGDTCVNAFVTKLNPSVPSYVFSTLLGGSSCDFANGVAVDTAGNVYVTGETASTNFPTANAFQPGFVGPQFNSDAFVTKLTPAGAFVYSTYLGGGGADSGAGIAADASGNAYITGFTNSTNFPTMNPLQPSIGSNFSTDVFLTKFNPSGSALVYSTYLGGSGNDVGRGVVVDSANNAYVTGSAASTEFPLVQGALRTKSPVYKSIDGGANWSNDNYGFTGTSLTGMAIDPSRTSTVYVSTLTGVFKTTNGGRTWSPINTGLDSIIVNTIVIDPVTPSTLYVGVPGFSPNSGIYKTTNGGANWNRHSNGMVATDITSLAIDPVTPNTLYASVSSGSGSKIYKTTDGAGNWALTGNVALIQPISLTLDPLNHNTIYVADTSSPGGIFKSTNAGVTWQLVGGNQVGPFPRTIAVSPFTAGLVYVDAGQGLFKSTDGGNNWTPVPNRAGKVVFDPVTSSTIYLLSSSQFTSLLGIFKSIDSGQTWLPIVKGLNTAQGFEMAIDRTKPSTLYLASTQSNGFDAFVTKFNAAGSALIYSTFIGGPINTQSFSGVAAQAFGIALDPSGNAYITGLTSAPGFPVSANAFQPFLRGFDDAFISKLSMSYIISGQVVDGGGAPVGGAEIVLNDGTSLRSIFSESDGSYQFSQLRDGGNFTITANKPHFTMAPASQTFNNLKADQVQNFTATASAAAFHTISGKVTENGNGLAGVTVTLSGSQPGIRTTDSNGNYSFELVAGGNYTVTPSVVGFNFAPPSSAFNNLSAPQTANFTANRQSFVVTNTNNHGAGSLRDAIINANATLGADTIVFNIPGAGVKTISLLTTLPEITERVSIDATTQPGYAGTPLVELDGLGVGTGSGFLIKAANSTVRGFAIVNFRSENGIWLNGADNNTIQANYIGVGADGTTARPNNRGILISNSANNVIGGTTAGTRNVISGNQASGIEINGNNNVIQGNLIGTNAAGTVEVRNSGGVSIFSSQFTNNLIGGTAAGAGNLISGNGTGVSANGNNTTVQGNLIGTNAAGTTAIPNSTGVQAFAENVLIGGVTPGARNVISGNLGEGVIIRGAGSKLQGNLVGTDISGTLALGNKGNGVVAGEGAVIGGTTPAARNIISANGNLGNVALGNNSSGNAATVQGNYIGTDITGTKALGGSIAGINIASNNNIIGGTAAGAGNVISGNTIGIQLGGFFSVGIIGNVIQGNLIGVNAAGTGPLSNTNGGIVVLEAVNSTIGGTQSGAGNKIAFNGGAGVSMSAGNANSIRGNAIFSNNGLGIDLSAPGVTANDLNDSDTGPNQLQNFPEITSVMSTSSNTTIQGTLKSIPNTAFQIDFYTNVAVDPSGNGEGAAFFNTTTINTDVNGNGTINVTFPVALPAGRVITATATDPNGNTSEFSASNGSGAAGSVQFNFSVMQVIEDVGAATIVVRRTGGSSGSLSVDYATANVTAIAGQDYTAASGTLTFNAGETIKTIPISIADDSTTESDETFTITLRNTPNLENLGSPSVLTVTIQDRTTVPVLTVSNASVTEGNTGTTDMFFAVTLSAATGRTVSFSYTTANFGAFGGGACSIQGADYEINSGTFTFQPGSTVFPIAVKICGDTSAEANETFRVQLTNATGATVLQPQGVGTIINDDVLELVLEENGPNPGQAAAVDARLAVRDPFRVIIPEWLRPTETDHATRVAFFARGLQLNPGELSNAVVVRFTASNGAIFQMPAEDVRAVPNSEFTQVTVRLPNTLQPDTYTVLIGAHSRISNTGTIRIVP